MTLEPPLPREAAGEIPRTFRRMKCPLCGGPSPTSMFRDRWGGVARIRLPHGGCRMGRFRPVKMEREKEKSK